MARRRDASMEGAPTAGEILGLYQIRLSEGDEAELRTNARSARQLTGLKHPVIIPSQYRAIAKEIRTPFIRDTWLRVTAALTRDTPVAHVEPRDITEPARTAANIAERFFLATLAAMSRERGEDLFYEDAKALVRDQEAVIKCVHKPDAWASFPKKEAGEDPAAYTRRTDAYKRAAPLVFAARVVDRLSMLFGDGEYGDEWALEYGEYPTSYLKTRYHMVLEDNPDGTGKYVEDGSSGEKMVRNRRKLVDPKDPEVVLGGKPAPEGELATGGPGMSVKVEYWDADYWCVVIDGTMAPGFPKKNPYAPRLPYFRAKSDPVLYALSYLVPGFDSLLTMWLNWAYIGAYATPQLVSSNADGVPNIGDVGMEMEPSGTGEQKAVTWKVGEMMEPPPGYHYEFIQPPPIGQDVQQMAQVYRQLIEAAGVSSILRGTAGSDASGYLANQLIAAATLTYKHLGAAMERQLAEMGEFMWHVITRRIKQEVYVLATEQDGKKKAKKTWLGLKPSGSMTGECAPIDMLAMMDVKLRPVLPTDEQARAMIATQLTNAAKPLDSRRHAMEHWLQYEDPEGILDEIAVDEALNSDPTLKMLQITAALQKAGFLPPQPSGLLDQSGNPMAASQQGSMIPPGQMAGGLPGIPGLTQPMIPNAPQAPGVPFNTGGRPPGAFPGQPGNQGPQILTTGR